MKLLDTELESSPNHDSLKWWFFDIKVRLRKKLHEQCFLLSYSGWTACRLIWICHWTLTTCILQYNLALPSIKLAEKSCLTISGSSMGRSVNINIILRTGGTDTGRSGGAGIKIQLLFHKKGWFWFLSCFNSISIKQRWPA